MLVAQDGLPTCLDDPEEEHVLCCQPEISIVVQRGPVFETVHTVKIHTGYDLIMFVYSKM